MVAKVQRCELEKHMTSCEWRHVTCPHYGRTGNYQYISGYHVEKERPKIILACGNEGCSATFKRSWMVSHHMVCPKQIVSCQYSSVGCKMMLKRKSIPSHNQQLMEEHLEKATATTEEFKDTIEELCYTFCDYILIHIRL